MDNQRPKLNAQELQQLQWLLGGVLSLFAIWSVFYLDVEALGAVLEHAAGHALQSRSDWHLALAPGAVR